MGDYSWFKLLVRAVGLLLLGLSAPMLLWSLGNVLLEQFGYSYAGRTSADMILVRLPALAGYGAQMAMGAYLLFGGSRIIEMCLAGVRYRCPACGYDIVGIKTGVCPECGTGIPRPGADSGPAAESVH